MSKILSKSGDSLADVYDVEGSIAGIDELLSTDVNLTHEMGATIFSERLSSRMLVLSTGAIAQNVTFAVQFSIGTGHGRILGAQVISDSATRTSHCQISVTSPFGFDDTDVPFFIFDVATDNIKTINIQVLGALSSPALLNPLSPIQLPQFLVGTSAPRPSNIISFRGRTTGFGAGTVTTRALVSIVFPEIGGLSSRGLPVPSW